MKSLFDASSGGIFQVAWVVRDIESAQEWFRSTMGVPKLVPFGTVVFDPEATRFRGRPAGWEAKIAIGYLGDTQVELIEPTNGASPYQEFLDTKGPGLHHVAFAVEDFEATVEALRKNGHEPLADGRMSQTMRVDFAYFEQEAAGAGVVELLGLDDAAASFMESLRIASAKKEGS